jgi:hypothetical protein
MWFIIFQVVGWYLHFKYDRDDDDNKWLHNLGGWLMFISITILIISGLKEDNF